MWKRAALLLFLCTVAGSYGQRVIHKSLVNEDARFFYLDAGQAYRIELETNNDDQIDVQAVVEGEYAESTLIDLRKEGSNVYISHTFSPEFQKLNDKLSAHKVVSVSLKISLPEEISLSVMGSSSHISVRGKYRNLSLELEEGRCDLEELEGIVSVTTASAEIIVMAKEGVVLAESDNGSLNIEKLPLGEAEYNLRSNSGNITVQRIRS